MGSPGFASSPGRNYNRPSMKVTVNGEPKEYPEALSLSALLRELGLERNPIAVELNRQVVPKDHHERTLIQEGDRLEIVTLVGGG